MSNFSVENGILLKDGKKTFLVGESYYPSFHAYKWPVPPEGDRMGEMKKDFKAMAEMGINHIRVAALGFAGYDKEGNFIIDTPFVDAMLREAEKLDISISVRLEGYSVNLRDFKDVLMVDEFGNPQDTSKWFDFIQTSLCHEGILEDNRIHAEKLANYYTDFPAVVAYQIYNEPHFPGSTVFDYGKDAIAAYRKWLVEKKAMTEEEAKDYLPPKTRREQSPRMWALWRTFSEESLNHFLGNAARAAKKAGKPVYTCFTDCNLAKFAPLRGVEPFGGSLDMDVVGFTDYNLAEGQLYFAKSLLCDMQTDIAEAQGKTAWCIEQDCRVVLPARQFEKGVYLATGSGLKGLVYYQWRGDAPSIGTPNPNSCGAVNYDGTKTVKFDSVKNCTALLNRLSDLLVETHPVYSGFGIYCSSYAVAMSDAIQNDLEKRADTKYNDAQAFNRNTYYELANAGYRPAITDKNLLPGNPLGIRFLLTPLRSRLSDEDVEVIENFKKNGGLVFSQFEDKRWGFREWDEEPVFSPIARSNCMASHTMAEIMAFLGAPAFAVANSPLIQIKPLKGPDFAVLAVINVGTPAAPEYNAEITTEYPHKTAVLYNADGERELETDGRHIQLGKVNYDFAGGFVVLR